MKIRVIAPARWIAEDTYSGFAESVSGWADDVRADPHTHTRHGQLAGDDLQRAAALSAGLADPDADILWCARGGYGAARIIRHVQAADAGKILAGYSDITALFGACRDWGVLPVHAPMPVDVDKPGGADRLKAAASTLAQIHKDGAVPAAGFDLEPVVPGEASGPVMCGNLAVMASLVGTPFELDPKGGILILEDVGEYRYSLDRMIFQLSQSRLSARVSGIVLGDFSDTQDNEIPWGSDIEDIVALHFPGIPVARGMPVGHAGRNTAIVIGQPGHLSVGASGHLALRPCRIHQPAMTLETA